MAHGAEVDGAHNVITFTAEPGEANQVRVTTSRSEEDVFVTDESAPLTAVGPECVSQDPHTARCSYDPACVTCGSGLDFVLRDRRDTIHLAGRRDTGIGVNVRAGPGRDRVTSKWFSLYAAGGSGDDVILGGAGWDLLDGGVGSDLVNGRGGSGDTATYVGRSEGVTVTLDARANDGERDERDRVIAENVDGGEGADVLVGDGEPNTISGEGGDDTIVGGRSGDSLVGGAGADRLDGGRGRGNDALLGDDGDDQLLGRAGADRLRGNNGADDHRCGPGDDYAESYDFGVGRPMDEGISDSIRCGSGRDTVTAGAEDSVGRECEAVTRGSPRARSSRYVKSMLRTTVSLFSPSAFVR